MPVVLRVNLHAYVGSIFGPNHFHQITKIVIEINLSGSFSHSKRQNAGNTQFGMWQNDVCGWPCEKMCQFLHLIVCIGWSFRLIFINRLELILYYKFYLSFTVNYLYGYDYIGSPLSLVCWTTGQSFCHCYSQTVSK